MDNMLQDIVQTDPDQVLREAMASRQATNNVPVNSEPRISTIPDQTINNDNMSESNFSCRTTQTSESNQQKEPVFKMPPTMDPHLSFEKEILRAARNLCKDIKKHMPLPQQCSIYYNMVLNRIESSRYRLMADALDGGYTSQAFMQNSMLMNSVVDFNATASQYSNQRGFVGFPGPAVGNILNDTTRSAATMMNSNRSHMVSSTTVTPPENVNNGTFLAPKGPAMRACPAEPHRANFKSAQPVEDVHVARSATNASQVGEGSFFARPPNPPPPQVPNKQKENLRRSKDKNPSPAAKSSPANTSVRNSPINMNSTVNSTINRSSAVNSTFSRQSRQAEVFLKNWTLRIGQSARSKDPELYVQGTIAKKCAFGSPNREIITRAVTSRGSDSCVRTKDGVFYLQGHFQNSRGIPKAITSFYLKNRTIPKQWKKMLNAWASLRYGSKAEEESRSCAEDSPLNSTMTRQKTQERTKIRKTFSPAKKFVAKPMSKPSPKLPGKPAANPVKKVLVNPVSRPPVKVTSRLSSSTPVKKPKSKFEGYNTTLNQRKYTTNGGRKQESSATDSCVNSPAEVRAKKRPIRPPSKLVDSEINTSVESNPKKRKHHPAPRYWNENDISQSETEKSDINFADSSADTSSFKIVSPGKTLKNIKKFKDSNIINSQVTPPSSYFTKLLSNSEKKSEKAERMKKNLKRLTSRVVKKGRTTANIQNLGPKLSSKDPKEIKKFIQESDVRLSKISVHSKSQLESEMSDFSDVMDEYMD